MCSSEWVFSVHRCVLSTYQVAGATGGTAHPVVVVAAYKSSMICCLRCSRACCISCTRTHWAVAGSRGSVVPHARAQAGLRGGAEQWHVLGCLFWSGNSGPVECQYCFFCFMHAKVDLVIGAVMILWTRVSDTTTVVFDDQTLGCLSS